MQVIGIVAAKRQSLRFPGKNKHMLAGKPLFWHSVEPLVDSDLVGDVIVSSDCPEIQEYCSLKGVEVQHRHINAIENEAPLLGVLKQVCLNYHSSFDCVVTIMANCPGHKVGDVEAAISLMKEDTSLNEIRSFDAEGNETGLMMFRKHIILEAASISSHIGAIQTEGFEVHFKEDLDKYQA